VPRPPRYPLIGVPQHVIQRGNNRQPTFFIEDEGRKRGRESFPDSSYRGRGSERAITMGTLPGTGYLIKTGD